MKPKIIPGEARRVLVVGAGIAGLSCAWALHKQGFDVTVLEAAGAPGGRCREVEIDGLRVRAGARMLYSFYAGVMGLIDELGLREDMLPIGHASIQCEAAQERYPLTFGPSKALLLGAAIPLAERLKLPKLLADLLKARLAGDPDDWLSLPQFDECSLADYLGSKGLGGFNARVVAPLFRGARNWQPEEVSAGFFLLTTAFMSGHYAFTFKQGIGHLAESLAKRLEVIYHVQVASIEPGANGVRVCASVAGQATEYQADLVVCAVEGDRARALLRQPDAEVDSFLSQVRYNPLSVDYAVLDTSVAHSLVFHAPGHASGLSILESVPGGTGKGEAPRLFCQASPEQSRQPSNDEAHRQSLARLAQSAFPEAPVQRWVHQRIESMLPLPYPGYLAALKDFRHAQAAAPQRLYFAGDYLSMALVGGACASGQRTASTILSHWPHATSTH